MARVDDIELAHFQREKFLGNKKVLSVDNIEKKLKRNSNEIISKYKEDDSKETNKPIFDLIKNTNFISKDRIFKVTLGEDNKEEFKKKFSGLHSKDSKNAACQYVWVSFTKDEQVLEVGRTSFNADFRNGYGDVFNRISLRNNKTVDILVNILSQGEETGKKDNLKYFVKDNSTEELKEISVIDMIKNVDADLSDFITQAIIIPLDISSIRYKESIAVASKIETLVGEYLVNFAKNEENLVPVISPKSHLYY